ncbi:D-alanyl-D-alanine carboxypeptidase [Pontiella desulfatans]|uniref:D-alanyl-D-alanine carboxypeptidase n=1 Tax=Pontiella desulfatans TaxID=2750659 RepID=A0A6C2UAJ5_PONDE|nr:serine hydrolase domain-containing protein [Pontiella desulfatans]VGO17142.1 D-alanyl-D-alanine carboxypeptidase [Pontiella desulfatans]
MNLSSGIIIAASLPLLIPTSYAKPEKSAGQSKEIEVSLKGIIERENLPGMVAAIASSEGIVAIGAAGVRKDGSREEFTQNDVIHLGSCTKAMTSTLLATFVADGTITWETTLIEVMPELRKRIHPDYHNVTVWQLLTHRAGVPVNAKDWWAHPEMKLEKRRVEILKDSLEDAPKAKKGEYLYSNLGYMIAACMVEQKTGDTWEELIEERLFKPLDMDSAGFGPPGKRGRKDQPWGHNKSGKKWSAMQSDNAEALGPAGRVHCSVEDWAKFIALQLPNGKGQELSFGREHLKKLITPVGDYAGGWIVAKRSWGNGVVLTHSGSNTMWYATVWVASQLDRAFIVVTNSCDEDSHAICDKMIGELIRINSGS